MSWLGIGVLSASGLAIWWRSGSEYKYHTISDPPGVRAWVSAPLDLTIVSEQRRPYKYSSTSTVRVLTLSTVRTPADCHEDGENCEKNELALVLD